MKRIVMVMAVMGHLAMGQAVNAGAEGGPKRAMDRVRANATDVYTVVFEEDEPAMVGVKGDGDTRLFLTVYDANGNLIASDSGNICLVRWTPRWTGRFTIKVTNLGRVYNNYVMVTN
jgi:hypothetical protein